MKKIEKSINWCLLFITIVLVLFALFIVYMKFEFAFHIIMSTYAALFLIKIVVFRIYMKREIKTKKERKIVEKNNRIALNFLCSEKVNIER